MTDYPLDEPCLAKQPRHVFAVFAVFPHMHKLGTEMDVSITPSGGTTGCIS